MSITLEPSCPSLSLNQLTSAGMQLTSSSYSLPRTRYSCLGDCSRMMLSATSCSPTPHNQGGSQGAATLPACPTSIGASQALSASSSPHKESNFLQRAL